MADRSIADGDDDGKSGDVVRFSISLPAYICYEIDGLKGMYGASRPQIVARILDEWFHQNEEQIARRRARFEDFQRSRSRSGDAGEIEG